MSDPEIEGLGVITGLVMRRRLGSSSSSAYLLVFVMSGYCYTLLA
jgi:hypothetical protein